MATMNQTEIDALNNRARELAADRPESEVLTALDDAAREAGLSFVARDAYCVLYQDAAGCRVNCWEDAPDEWSITEGGLGFDDQTEIVESRLAACAESDALS